jgi:hypothetical protein
MTDDEFFDSPAEIPSAIRSSPVLPPIPPNLQPRARAALVSDTFHSLPGQVVDTHATATTTFTSLSESTGRPTEAPSGSRVGVLQQYSQLPPSPLGSVPKGGRAIPLAQLGSHTAGAAAARANASIADHDHAGTPLGGDISGFDPSTSSPIEPVNLASRMDGAKERLQRRLREQMTERMKVMEDKRPELQIDGPRRRKNKAPAESRMGRLRTIMPATNSLSDMKRSIRLLTDPDGVTREREAQAGSAEMLAAKHLRLGDHAHQDMNLVQSGIKKLRSAMPMFERFLHDTKLWWQRRQYSSHDFFLFRGSLKRIEGYFGSGVVSVFVFLRWICLMNLALAVSWLALVVAPFWALQGFTAGATKSLSPLLAIGGEGLENTFAFYGGYPAASSKGSYAFETGYFFATLIMFVGSFVSLFFKMAARVRQRYDRAALVRRDRFYPFSSLIYTSWDYAICKPQAAVHLHRGIATTLMETIGDLSVELETIKESKRKSWGRFLGRLLGITLSVLVLSAVFVIISLMVVNEASLVKSTTVFIIPIAVSVFNLIFPIMVRAIVRLERWSPRVTVQQNIIRVFVLKIFTLFILMVRIYSQVNSNLPIPVIGGKLGTTSGLASSSAATPSSLSDGRDCAETQIGKQVVRLVISEMVVSSLGTVAWGAAGKLFFKARFEFDIPEVVIATIYRQALIWIGAVFCPVLPVIGVVSNVLLFFVIKYTSLWACTPPEHPWGASRTSNFFLAFLSVTLLLSAAPIVIFIRVQTSQCGPYAGTVPWGRMGEIIAASSGAGFFSVISSPIVLVLLLSAACVALFFSRAHLAKSQILLQEALIELEREHDEKISLIKEFAAQQMNNSINQSIQSVQQRR